MSKLHPGLRRGGQLASRVLFSLIFIVAGTGHLFAPGEVAVRLARAPGAFLVDERAAGVLILLSGVALVAGGVALALGLLTRWAAAGLFLVLLPITLTVQVGGAQGLGPLFKNIALIGGLLHFAFEGAGAFSLDNWLRNRPRAKPMLAGVLGALLVAVALPAQAGKPVSLAQPSTEERVLLLVQQPPQLVAALTTGEQSLRGEGFPAKEVEIIVCGPAIASLVKGHPLEPRLEAAKKRGLRVVACGLTLEEKGISRDAITAHVGIVDNGLVEALKRQAEGFRSVEL